MSLVIRESFRVQSPAERVWRYLLDPAQIVDCLPGAELTSVQDERTYLGKVKVKVGPVTAAYSGKATIVEADVAQQRMRLVAEGKESVGSGAAKMSMMSELIALPDGATEVRVEATIDVVGKVAQFGRGLMETVSRELFKQFVNCVREKLESPGAKVDEADAVTTAPASPIPRLSSPAQPVQPLTLLLRALWAAIRGLFTRRPIQS
jgi:carbon monoxide dehydrogenase subunit G